MGLVVGVAGTSVGVDVGGGTAVTEEVGAGVGLAAIFEGVGVSRISVSGVRARQATSSKSKIKTLNKKRRIK